MGLAKSPPLKRLKLVPQQPPPVLQETTQNSTSICQENLELFQNAKDWFANVLEVGGAEGSAMKENEMDIADLVEEIWGHEGRPHCFSLFSFFHLLLLLYSAIVYACTPPSFQTPYFSFRQSMALPTGDYPDKSDSIQLNFITITIMITI